MSSDRMKAAMKLAEKCWHKAYCIEPEFIENYIGLAENLLASRPIVTGDQFREHCRLNKVYLPKTLHHNTWVSGVKALQLMGWLEPIGKATPQQMHNHMPEVTLWKSKLFDGSIDKQSSQISLTF